ncbi:helix-turn-helix domain-containing protein [Bradyrhizobium sp. USDA 10063]
MGAFCGCKPSSFSQRIPGSFLHVAQPSLSRLIEQLEEEFGVELLVRHAGGHSHRARPATL